jgi:hypothetical protein
MKDLNFNIYGFIKPTTKAEYMALFQEAHRLADELHSQLDEIDQILAVNTAAAPDSVVTHS